MWSSYGMRNDPIHGSATKSDIGQPEILISNKPSSTRGDSESWKKNEHCANAQEG